MAVVDRRADPWRESAGEQVLQVLAPCRSRRDAARGFHPRVPADHAMIAVEQDESGIDCVEHRIVVR
jgi:hypothetical protein